MDLCIYSDKLGYVVSGIVWSMFAIMFVGWLSNNVLSTNT